MKVTGTLINYYFHCKRQCYLFYHRMNLEDNSEDVKIGKILHEIKALDGNNTELKFENIAIDKITDRYVMELKKSDSDMKAARMQVLLYLKRLEEKGIKRDGKLIFHERNSKEKVDIIKLNEKTKAELDCCMKEIENLVNMKSVPQAKLIKGCKKCAYYEYCYL